MMSGNSNSGSKDTQIQRLENKVEKLDKKFDNLRANIKKDMQKMLEEFLGKSKNSEEINQSEDIQDESQ